MVKVNDRISNILAFIVVLWPAGLWVIGFIVVQLAHLNGCKVWARGPEECLLLGVDFGEYLYPLSALGYYFVGIFLWVPIGLILLGFIRFIRRTP